MSAARATKITKAETRPKHQVGVKLPHKPGRLKKAKNTPSQDPGTGVSGQG